MPRPLSRMTPATLDVLERLESHEWVVSEWEADGARPGARRRLYRLVPEARQQAADAVQHARERAAAARAATTPRPRPARASRPRPALGGAA